jgi:hypothetical protein
MLLHPPFYLFLALHMVKRLLISLVPVLKVVRLMLPCRPLVSLPTSLRHLKFVVSVVTLVVL